MKNRSISSTPLHLTKLTLEKQPTQTTNSSASKALTVNLLEHSEAQLVIAPAPVLVRQVILPAPTDTRFPRWQWSWLQVPTHRPGFTVQSYFNTNPSPFCVLAQVACSAPHVDQIPNHWTLDTPMVISLLNRYSTLSSGAYNRIRTLHREVYGFYPITFKE
jgi:hypothetical protein